MQEQKECTPPATTAVVASVVDEIIRRAKPRKIYLYNQRVDSAGSTTAFKLCVIGDFPDKAGAERELYLKVDCEVPFDILLYTQKEWEQLCSSPTSFARKIYTTGTVLYG